MDEKKIKFEQYGIEFDENEFDNMDEKELRECKKILDEIEKMVEEGA